VADFIGLLPDPQGFDLASLYPAWGRRKGVLRGSGLGRDIAA